MAKQLNLFSDRSLTWQEQLENTASSLNKYGKNYDYWVFCFSGGKDSTATVTVANYLFNIG
ncbi:MAG: FAD synthetase, partial [Okeania sp. SIO2H7]|nr:FAD synthetase [Okeania sp. SIO2H7]